MTYIIQDTVLRTLITRHANGVAVSVETILKLGLMNRETQCTTTEPTNHII